MAKMPRIFYLIFLNHFLSFFLHVSDDDFDMSRYSSSGYSSAEVRLHPLPPQTTGARQQGWGSLGAEGTQVGHSLVGDGAPHKAGPGLGELGKKSLPRIAVSPGLLKRGCKIEQV